MNLASVINPGHTENDLALRLDHSLKKSHLFILGMLLNDGLQRFEDFLYRLQEKRVAGIALLDPFNNAGNVSVHKCLPPQKN
ncbi:hypothetical protein SDC9_116685 [bioreactor metagenome]|uniref:Uncharacterized protein n=1 Tax=bioreactor metagenome TaxID=1076179 RepID=A0A645BX31_9ZZZZ